MIIGSCEAVVISKRLHRRRAQGMTGTREPLGIYSEIGPSPKIQYRNNRNHDETTCNERVLVSGNL